MKTRLGSNWHKHYWINRNHCRHWSPINVCYMDYGKYSVTRHHGGIHTTFTSLRGATLSARNKNHLCHYDSPEKETAFKVHHDNNEGCESHDRLLCLWNNLPKGGTRPPSLHVSRMCRKASPAAFQANFQVETKDLIEH